MRSDLDLRKLVDSSGYPFQLRIEHAIRTARDVHGWQIIGSEYPWKHPTSAEEGFADIVIGKGNLIGVLECKRLAEAGTYLFLIPSGGGGLTRRFRCLGMYYPGSIPQSWWDDVRLDPEAAESEYCVVEGTGPKDKPILERVGAELVRAVEAVVQDQLELHKKSSRAEGFWAGFPILVTNAQLVVCEYPPEAVSLETGRLDPSAGVLRPVNIVQLRKGLSTDTRNTRGAETLTDLHDQRQRSLMVVHSSHLVEALKVWTVSPLAALSSKLPWLPAE